MRIGLASQSFDHRTGIGRIATSLAAELIALGHDVIGAAQEFEEVDPRITKLRVPRLSSSKGINKLLFRLNGFPFERSKIDIAHTFGVGRGVEIVSAQSCHRAGMELLRGKGHMGGRNLGFYDYISLVDERALLTSQSTRRIIAVSHLVRTQIQEYYPVDPLLISIVPNGVDYKAFERLRSEESKTAIRLRLGLSNDRFVLLFVGNEFERKGLHVLLRAVKALGDQSAYLLVVGAGDQGAYGKLASDLGISNQVGFAGSIPNPEKLYMAADVFVLPTLYEPFGIVVLEAMAAGIPVITSQACGATEGMRHQEHVLFLENPTFVEELVEAVRLLRRDDNLREKMIAAGLERAREFSWDRVAQRVAEIYNEVRRSL